MKRKSVLVSVILIVIILCTSCGTKLPEAGDYTEEDSASGSAVDSAQNARDMVKKENIHDKVPFCNDEHCYWFIGGNLCQYKLGHLLDDTSQNYRVKNGEDVTIWCVNNKEIFYVSKKNEVWRIPIAKNKDGACPQVDKAEKVLTDKNDIIDVYADDDYIVYLSRQPATGNNVYKYNEYDRKAGKKISVGTEFATISERYNLSQVAERGYVLLAGDYVRLDKKDSMFHNGVYIHKIGSGKVTKIDDGYFPSFFDDGTQDAIGLSRTGVRAADGKFYYYGRWDGKEKAGMYPQEEQDIWVYDTQTGKKEIFVSKGQLTKSAAKNKVGLTGNYFMLQNIYIDRGKMYIYAYVYGAYAVFSKELSGGSGIKYEKGASQFLTSIERNVKGGYLVNIAEGKLLTATGSDLYELMVKCYDLSKETHKNVEVGDTEYEYILYGMASSLIAAG